MNSLIQQFSSARGKSAEGTSILMLGVILAFYYQKQRQEVENHTRKLRIKKMLWYSLNLSPLSFHPSPQVCSIYLCLHCCPVNINIFISIILLDSIYVCIMVEANTTLQCNYLPSIGNMISKYLENQVMLKFFFNRNFTQNWKDILHLKTSC